MSRAWPSWPYVPHASTVHPSSKQRSLPTSAPYRTGRAQFTHPALQFVFIFSTESVGDVQKHCPGDRLRKWVEHQSLCETLPGKGSFLASAVEPLEGQICAGVVVVTQFGKVEAHSVVVIVSSEFCRSQIPEYIQFLAVSLELAPLFKFLNTLGHPLWGGFHLELLTFALASISPIEGETQKREFSIWDFCVK